MDKYNSHPHLNAHQDEEDNLSSEFSGAVGLERLHKYQLAQGISSGLDVLDISCGGGSGSYILAAYAKSVVGISENYDSAKQGIFSREDARISFRTGCAENIPVLDASMDLVVCFETIEHIQDYDRMMSEIRRVLREDGILMISSPFSLEGPSENKDTGALRLRDAHAEELIELIRRNFAKCSHYNQQISAASLVEDVQTGKFQVFPRGVECGDVTGVKHELIIASDGALPDILSSDSEISGNPLMADLPDAEIEEGKILLANKISETNTQIDKVSAEKNQTILQLIAHLLNTTKRANDVVQSKWWRGTRSCRRWSNNLRKRRGRAEKKWPEKFEIPEIVQKAQFDIAEFNGFDPEIWETHTQFFPTNGYRHPDAIPPYGKYGFGADLPVVKYSNIQERFYEYEYHKSVDSAVKAIAFYLPQFHPFPENDKWWGKGFTEWTNVGKAKPLFPGHHQPHCPIHLGYYDLRVPEVMEEQAQLAKNYGISGFAYYFYWFAGKRLMDRPLEAMRDNPNIDMPFCMVWANENWTRLWDGLDDEVLIAQDHSLEDSSAMLEYLKSFMEDPRYIKIDGKPLFVVYRAHLIPDFKETVQMWREQAKHMNLGGLYIVSAQLSADLSPDDLGVDGLLEFPPNAINGSSVTQEVAGLTPDFEGGIFDYDALVSREVRKPAPEATVFRTSMLSWDNTARRGLKASIFEDFSLTRYSQWLSANIETTVKDKNRTDDERIVFINAWNEWAEGAHLEPDQRYGYGYLEATRQVIAKYPASSKPFISPNIPDQTNRKYALIAHIHYAETWSDIQDRVNQFEEGTLDVYVTTTSEEVAVIVKSAMPDAVVELVDNRGRDVRPFLMMMKRIAHLKYRAICKVHGKKSVFRMDGDAQRISMLTALIDPTLIDRFERDATLGILAARDSTIEHDTANTFFNMRNIEYISEKLGLRFEKGKFVAGTMFWVDPSAIARLLTLDNSIFDIERGVSDGTVPHAIERIFINLVHEAGYRLDFV